MPWRRILRGLCWVLGGLAVLLVVFFLVARFVIDRSYNKTYTARSVAAIEKIHKSFFIVDLHADTLLWGRDLLRRSDYGHVDLPRLIEGNVAIQVFAVVTKTPSKGKAPEDAKIPYIDKNGKYPERGECVSPHWFSTARLLLGVNTARLLQIFGSWHLETWFDLEAHALSQADRLHDFAKESLKRHKKNKFQPYLMIIKNVANLRKLVTLRRRGVPVVGAILALEGAHWIGRDGVTEIPASVDKLFDAGFRMVAPTHRFYNNLGASNEGCEKQTEGLTKAGKAFLKAAEKKGMILDLAHASDKGVEHAAKEIAGFRGDKPIVLSHAGVRKTCFSEDKHKPKDKHKRWRCDVDRGTPDDLIRAVARTGGVIGIGFWPEAVGHGMENIAKAFAGAHNALYTEKFKGEMSANDRTYDPFDYIALGSDFDGAVKTPFDVSRLIELTTALLNFEKDGEKLFDKAALRKIFGTNACRVFALRLPDGGPRAAAEICG